MIQRIQTLYLLLAAATLGLFLGLAGTWLAEIEALYAWLPGVVYAIGGLTAALTLLSVFLYQKRATQGKAVAWAVWADLLLVIVLAIGVALSAFGEGSTTADMARASVVLLPVLAYLFLLLARRGVRRDVELVRSMDRLR